MPDYRQATFYVEHGVDALARNGFPGQLIILAAPNEKYRASGHVNRLSQTILSYLRQLDKDSAHLNSIANAFVGREPSCGSEL
jgi:hypothetical protein